jgi:phenylacetaldehyde dehydrogenase
MQPSPPGSLASWLAVPRPLLIGGQWRAASTGELQAIRDPATGETIASVNCGGIADIDLAVAAARRCFESRDWRRMAPAERARKLWRLADLIEQHADELAYLEAWNEGMPLALARILGAAGPAEALRYYAGWCTKIEGTTHTLSTPDPRGPGALGAPYHAWTQREPVGVVGAITPWNAPMVMAVAKIGPALAAGCTIVLKPAGETPLTALRLGELIGEAGFPPGAVNIVPGRGSEAGAHLAAHPDVDRVTFTGSTETGRKIAALSLGNLKRVALELGGKSPVIVCADADVDRTIPVIADAIFMNSGQICFAGTRVYVERRVLDRVVEGVAACARRLRLGPGLDPDTELGPLISARQRESVMAYIELGLRDGATLVTGGSAPAGPGYFVEPTIFVAPRNDLRIVREEIFGPVLTVVPFDTLEEAVRLANDTVYGLAAGVFTSSLSTAHGLADEIRAGSVWINCYAMLDEAMPTGGFRQSGWGREAGRVGVEEYTEIKSVVAAL